MKPFGQNFRDILRLRDLTQAEAAALLETSQSVISYYCSLKVPPRRRTLGIMSTRLNVSVAELTGEVEPAKPNIPEIESEDSVTSGMRDLKRRWRKKPNERSTITHLVAALFPKDAQGILAWLDKS